MAGGQCTYLCPINAKISHRPLLDCRKTLPILGTKLNIKKSIG